MKAFYALTLLGSLLAAPAMAETTPPVLKAATFNTVYVPGGFDSNDNVQIVGEGMFRNTCYRPAPTGFQVDQERKTVTVGPVAYEYAGLCLQVILPFDRVIDVGPMKAGTYSVIQQPGNVTLGTFKVREAKSSNPDDYLYAPISQAFFRQKGATSEIVLSGYMPTNCMHLDNVKVTVEEKVLVLQPISSIESRNDCLRGHFPFSKTVRVEGVKQGHYLLHVRSMNGKAINTLVDVKY